MIYRHMNSMAWDFVRYLIAVAIGLVLGIVLGLLAAGILWIIPAAQATEIYTERAPVLEFKLDHWELSYTDVRAISNAHVIVCFIIHAEHYAECFYVNDDQEIALIPQHLAEEKT